MRLLFDLRESIFGCRIKLANIPFDKCIRLVKFRWIGWPTNAYKNTFNFNGMRNECNNLHFFATYAYKRIGLINSCDKLSPVERDFFCFLCSFFY